MNEFKHLSPVQAASAADSVYLAKDQQHIGRIFSLSEVAGDFDFDDVSSQRVQARSGAFQFKSKTGFGVIAKGTGEFAGDAIIACRGTASLYDGLTDMNMGVGNSITGKKVHAGFNRTFNGFADDIAEFLRIHKPNVVHCVGHSLGGALATLSADFVVNKGRKAALYTFGCPRVGFTDLAHSLSLNANIGVKNIHRVFHSGDPVSMVPLWPFVHAPQPLGECYIGKSLDFNPFQHKMDNYIKSVASHDSWSTLRHPQPNWDSHMDQWLNSGNAGKYFGLNLFNLTMLIKAVNLVVQDTIRMGFTCVGMAGIAGATMLDGLSQILDKAAQITVEADGMIMNLMQRILSMLGVTIQKGQKLTHAFIRFVLEKLTLAINRGVMMSMMMVASAI